MPTTPELIADLISGYTDLKQYFEDVRSDIDTDRGQMRHDLENHMNTIDNRIALPPNLIQNAFMTELDEVDSSDENEIPAVTRPIGFSSSGLTIEAVHPYTQAFEGPYVEFRPENASDTPDLATQESPYWFSRYNMGSRSGRGGLSDGWGGIANGHILKVTATPGGSTDSRCVYFGGQRLAAHNKLWFRAFLKIVKGSRVCFGSDAGHQGKIQGLTFNKEQSDSAPEGWIEIDSLVSTSKTTRAVGGKIFSVGARNDETVEFYLALPYAYVPHTAKMGIVE